MITDSLYAKYIKERDNAEILEKEFGFVSYKLSGKECFIIDMYVDKPHRCGPTFKNLITELSEIALTNGCEVLSANIHTNDPNANKSIIAAIKIGFEIKVAQNGVILIIKKLIGGS